ncbi:MULTISPECIES: ABC transporter substrate-binding protein [unclassified Sinorhizobium]|uniref:ABC transporter substrate-binding protein n=1 Tax=unclassified Sinorhizobium TaxID=2613772 RepID=UPI0024C365E6|nr:MULTISPECIES: ABC transporter substrate-binding protein [unclassified Sinorhizobium]MDK1378279.1 ABC transporter substrate-binding protein [Sinorhizobium sp. 6-70]MDK1483131.1 ABC transporter substrate-binding protein [Sinorhizobium sp. 6-117]
MAGGAYNKVNTELFFQPFSQETGIEVITVDNSDGAARVKAMQDLGAVEWDILGLTYDDARSSDYEPLFESLGTCGDLPNVVTEGVEGSCLGTGVLWDSGGRVLVYDERAFPDGGPKTWAEFWDVKKFPGPRSLPGGDWPWYNLMIALLADGVPHDKLYPLDVDRAFAKLDELKSHIGVWWANSDQSQQILRSQEVVAAVLYNGRAARLKADGVPVQFGWDGALFEAAAFSILKGAPHLLAAKALLNFMYSRPEAHAKFAEKMYYALPNKNADKFMDSEFAKTLVTAPENWSKVAKVDPNWLNGKREALIERWTKWISA